MVVELVFAMLMIQNGTTIEYVPTEGMTDCLKQKRIVARSIGEEQEGIYIQCKERKAELENDMGRIRKKKWDSRTIDIDILFFDKQIIKTKELIIPHKHLDQRMFVLRPLADIAPFFIHPESKKNIKQLIKECKDDSKVFEYEF